MPESSLAVLAAGTNSTLIWGIDNSERLRRIAAAVKLPLTESASVDGPALVVDLAFVFDPAWLRFLASHPGEALTIGNRPVIAHARDAAQKRAVLAAIEAQAPLAAESGFGQIVYESGAEIVNEALRKRERPFAIVLTPETVREAERASYFGAYKGVTDLLTKYLWPEWALVLTRIAAKIGLSPNMVTTIGAILCVLATFAFARGDYWQGMAMGLVFMVLDTVDGKLARCTITSSAWGNIFDHGMDIVHPPFWWWFWATGLGAWGLSLSTETFWIVQGTMLAGYVIQRLIEGAFIAWFGMHIHVWRKFDSDFRLITARRNPNMVILFVATLAKRPDIGIVAVAAWTAISMAVHAVRLVQAALAKARGAPPVSWLDG